MIEKIKKEIDSSKKNNETHKEYIKAFCNSSKAKELFNENEEFIELSKTINDDEKNEE